MAKVTVKVDDGEFRSLSTEILNYVNRDVPRKSYTHFRNLTPVRSGNARNKTKLRTGSDQHVIMANYPYAQRLDTGWSGQAPRGMTEPTIKYIEGLINNKVRTL